MNKYRLVPATENTVSQGNMQLQQQALSNSEPPNNLMPLLELFPPKLRHRAMLMLGQLKDKIGLTDDNRIIYLEPEREQGSPLYDLIYFFVSPTPPNGHQIRPPDVL